MSFGSLASTSQSMSNLRGYSDFFASGLRNIARPLRPSSLYSSPSCAGSENIAPVLVEALPLKSHQLKRRRPLSMIAMLPSSSKTESGNNSRRSFASFSSRFLDRISFISSEDNSSSRKSKHRLSSTFSKTPVTEVRKPAEVWITTGGPRTPSVPNGVPDTARSEGRVPLDPFDSSPDSKSFFIDLSDSSPATTPKRDSFLSMSTTSNSNSSPARSLVHLPQRRERPVSIQTMPVVLPSSRARRSSSSFQSYRHPAQEKSDFWILEEEDTDVLSVRSQPGMTDDPDYETRDVACIDWRQFHNDLLTVDA